MRPQATAAWLGQTVDCSMPVLSGESPNLPDADVPFGDADTVGATYREVERRYLFSDRGVCEDAAARASWISFSIRARWRAIALRAFQIVCPLEIVADGPNPSRSTPA
jgi:hypothetical protein